MSASQILFTECIAYILAIPDFRAKVVEGVTKEKPCFFCVNRNTDTGEVVCQFEELELSTIDLADSIVDKIRSLWINGDCAVVVGQEVIRVTKERLKILCV